MFKRGWEAAAAMMERDREVYTQIKEMLEKMRPTQLMKKRDDNNSQEGQTMDPKEEDAMANGIGRQQFEPKPRHAPAPTDEQIRADNAAFMDAIVNHRKSSALDTQVGGDHYKKLKIQPMEYSMANGLDACQHSVVRYVTRFRDKGGIQDLEKAKHCIDLLIEFEGRKS